MMTSAQVVKTSVNITDNSPSQDYTHLENQTTLLQITFLSYYGTYEPITTLDLL